MSEAQPGPVRRLGKSYGSLLFRPSGSPSLPKTAVKGAPSFAFKMPPSSHPFAIQFSAGGPDFGPGRLHVPLITRVRGMLNSASPRLNRRSNQWRLETELVSVSPAIVPELLSMLLPQVKEPCS